MKTDFGTQIVQESAVMDWKAVVESFLGFLIVFVKMFY